MGVLDGIKTVSIAFNLPGPVLVSELKNLGSDCWKIEPLAGDPLMAICPDYYEELSRGQKVLRLDLKSEAGRKELYDLLGDTDVLIMSSRPSSLVRLGLDQEKLLKQFPQLLTLSLLGYPNPDQEKPGHDLNYLVEAGLWNSKQMPLTCWTDLIAAQKAVTVVLEMILKRNQTQKGEYREISIFESLKRHREALEFGLTKLGGVLGGGWASYDIYQIQNGMVAVGVIEPHFSKELLKAMGSNETELIHQDLRDFFKNKTKLEIEDLAKAHGLPLSVF